MESYENTSQGTNSELSLCKWSLIMVISQRKFNVRGNQVGNSEFSTTQLNSL